MRIEPCAEKSVHRLCTGSAVACSLICPAGFEMEPSKTSYCAASAGVKSSGLLWLLCRLALIQPFTKDSSSGCQALPRTQTLLSISTKITHALTLKSCVGGHNPFCALARNCHTGNMTNHSSLRYYCRAPSEQSYNHNSFSKLFLLLYITGSQM